MLAPINRGARGAVFALLLVFVASPLLGGVRWTLAQDATPSALSCVPAPPPSTVLESAGASTRVPSTPATGNLVPLKVGFVPVSIYAPIFVAKEKGYYAEQGLDVTLEPLAGGADLVALTASGQLQATAAGAGPAFWNAMAQGLPLRLIAPGHGEGVPVATPLMIPKAACESGQITRVADLKGTRVSVNARGATEYWLAQALATDGLTLDDIDLQTLPFPDAVVALGAGTIDAAMVGEPLATKAEQDGIAVRLATDFPVQDVLPTAILANADFAEENPTAIQGLVTAYLKACRELSAGGFRDPTNLAIIEQYTGVPAALIGSAIPPVYAVDGEIDAAALGKLQAFFRERGQLEYEQDLDPEGFIDRRYVEAALAELGPFQQE